MPTYQPLSGFRIAVTGNEPLDIRLQMPVSRDIQRDSLDKNKQCQPYLFAGGFVGWIQ
jgi:hypothetical protein